MQGLGQRSHILIQLAKQRKTGASLNHNMTFLNRSAVILDVKVCLMLDYNLGPLSERNHPKEYVTPPPQKAAPIVTGKI